MKARKRRKKKSGCAVFLAVLVVLVAAVVVFVYSGMFARVRLSIEHSIYPIKYEQEIRDLAQEYGFEPEFICAVIYAESKFDENASSAAGAIGLMQLMPDTFLWLSEKRGEDVSSEDIKAPYVNLDYGVYYLDYLYDRFGDINTACAAYNAGPTKVDQWLSNPQYSDDGETLSNIPYAETSGYVKKIQDTTLKYKELYFS